MSGFGRRGVNVSQFLADGNTILSPSDIALDDPSFNLDTELAKFTNDEWTEYDAGNFFGDASTIDFGGKRQKIERSGQDGEDQGFVNGDFPYTGSNPFDFLTPDAPLLADFQGQTPTFPFSQTSQQEPSQISTPTTPYTPTANNAHKRPASHPSPSAEPETESARKEVEEDKRRRNTAASARFRIKKKEREKALEKTAEDLKEKVKGLEQRNEALVQENKFLKELVIQRDGSLRERNEETSRGNEPVDGRREHRERKGVGTKGVKSGE